MAEYESQSRAPEPETGSDHDTFLEHPDMPHGALELPRPAPEHLQQFSDGLAKLDPERRARIDKRVQDFIEQNPHKPDTDKGSENSDNEQ